MRRGTRLRAGDPCLVSIGRNTSSSEEFVFSWPLDNLQPNPPSFNRSRLNLLDGECTAVAQRMNLTLTLAGGPAWLQSVSFVLANASAAQPVLELALRLQLQVRMHACTPQRASARMLVCGTALLLTLIHIRVLIARATCMPSSPRALRTTSC